MFNIITNNITFPHLGGGGNNLNLIYIHSKNVFDNIIRDSDLNGTIVAGSSNAWNILNSWVVLQDNTDNTYHLYHYTDTWYDKYPDKSLINYNTILGIRFLIKYRE